MPSNSINKIVNYNGTIIAGTEIGLSKFNGVSWEPLFTSTISSPIVDMYIENSFLYIIANNAVYRYENGNLEVFYTNSDKAFFVFNKLVFSKNQKFYGSNLGIVASVDPVSVIVPDGPSSNSFPGISVDKNGNVWSGSGSNVSAVGFYKYDGNKWTNYTREDVPGSNSNVVFKVYTAPDNTIYFLSFGDGFYRLKNGQFQVFNAKNTDLNGIPSAVNDLYVEGLSVDSKGNLWVFTYGSENKKPLAVLKTDSTWTYYSNGIGNEIIQGYDLLVDQYDTKWMIEGKFESQNGEGLYFFNENRTLEEAKSNGWGSINSFDGLNSTVINAIALDRRGELWVGTGEGINVIPNTLEPYKITTVYTLSSQIVTALAVDALNQKWVGTQQGLFLLSSDGTKLLASYTASNSPLPGDQIKSISINNNTGTVYIGTDFGLASLTTSAVNPQETFSDIFIYPNPVYLDKSSPVTVTIDGLIRDTDIKILDISGKLINYFSSPGGRIASWDGKDVNGNLVNSGIYLIVAYDQEGNSVATAKVAILRK